MATQKLGVKNIKKLLEFGFELQQDLTNVLEDGKVSFFEATRFIGTALELSSVVKSWPEVKKELADLDSDERADLLNFAIESLSIPNEEVENFVEHAVQWTVSTLALIELGKKLKK